MKAKNNNKYNRKLKYRLHHQLSPDFSNYRLWLFWIGVISPIIIVLGYFEFIYPSIKSIELAIFAVSVFYLFILRPAIMKGRITAFYRRSYEGLTFVIFLYSRIAMIATGKVIGTCLFYIIVVRDFEFIIEVAKVLFEPYHPVYTRFVIALSLILFYLVFYHDRYVSIREYSNEINYRIKELNFGLRSAVEDFMAHKDREYGIKEFNGMYYDYEEQKQEEEKKTLKNKKKINKTNENLVRRSSRN